MKQTCAIVFRPPVYGIVYVKGLKDILDKKIGWFHSRNSEAHITILEVEIEESQLPIVIAFLNRFCRSLAPFMVHFDAFGTYPKNGAFFLEPDKASKDLLMPLMKTLGARFPFSADKVTDPHMSIARRLDAAKLALTQKSFASERPNLSFQCDAVYLRKYNADREQYDIIETFPFGNEPNHKDDWPVQAKLFS